MGSQPSKIVDPKANVVNELEIQTNVPKLAFIETLLTIITIISCVTFVLRIYAMHNKKLKKRYQSTTNINKI